MTWENVEITADVRALVERERRLAQAEEHLLDAVRSMRLARQALGDAIVPLVVIHEIEAMTQRLPGYAGGVVMSAYVRCECPRNAPPGPPSPPEWHCHGCGYWNPSLGRDDRPTTTCRTCGAAREAKSDG